jgi:soluble lytic murein transglycosylase-like protein
VRRYLGFLVALAAIVVASPPVLAAAPVAEMGVPEGYRRVAAAHGIPGELFYAVALAESGKHIEHLRMTRPWPWTLNIQGEGRYFPSRQAAVVAAQEALAKGRWSIDIGLMQVNWAYHRTALRSVEAAIDPYHNLDVGAGILAECFRTLGDWWAAAGCYHAPGNAERAARYRERVKRIWSRVTVTG